MHCQFSSIFDSTSYRAYYRKMRGIPSIPELEEIKRELYLADVQSLCVDIKLVLVLRHLLNYLLQFEQWHLQQLTSTSRSLQQGYH